MLGHCSQKILIMGAGIYQVPLINLANSLGMTTIAVTIPGPYPGVHLASCTEYVDIRDHIKVLDIAYKHRIDAITTVGSDVGVPSIGYVCDHLHLPGISYDTALRVTHKRYMKETFVAHNILTPEFQVIKHFEELGQYKNHFDYPVIVKSLKNSGSKGMAIARTAKQLEQAYRQAIAVDEIEEVIVETFIKGTKFGVQAVVVDGELNLVLINNDTTKYVNNVPLSVGPSFPSLFSSHQQQAIVKIVAEIVTAFKLNNCIINLDMIERKGRFYALEIAGRLGATCLPELIKHKYKIDMYQIALDLALGQRPNIAVEMTPLSVAALLVQSYLPGVLQKIECHPKVKYSRYLSGLSFDVKPGDTINSFSCGSDRIGEIITMASAPQKALKIAQRIHDSIRIETL